MSEQVSVLVRDELKLAQLEMTRKGKQAGAGVGMQGSGIVARCPFRSVAEADKSRSAQIRVSTLSGEPRVQALGQLSLLVLAWHRWSASGGRRAKIRLWAPTTASAKRAD
jgi:hypothetical protein